MSTRLNGYVEQLHRHEVTGWAFDPAKPEAPVEVQLWVDGRQVSAARADRERPDLKVLELGRIDLGFRLPVPHGTLLDHTRLAVRVAGRPASLPINKAGGTFEGLLDVVEPGRMVGWAWHVGAPRERVTLLVRSGDKTLGRVTAGAFREDLRDAGVGDGAHGFEVLLPATAKDITIVIEANGQALSSVPRSTGRDLAQPVARPPRAAPPPRATAKPRATAVPATPTISAPPAPKPRRLTPTAATPTPPPQPAPEPPKPAPQPAPQPAPAPPPPAPAPASRPALSPEVIEAMRAALRLDNDDGGF